MARRSGSVTQADITRLIKGALAAGIYKEHIIGVKLDRDGATLLFGEQAQRAEQAKPTTTDDSSWGDVDAA